MKEPAGGREPKPQLVRRRPPGWSFKKHFIISPFASRAWILAWIFQLPADDVVDEERLPDDFHSLHLLHRFGDQQQIGKQDTVDVHLGTNAFRRLPSQEPREAVGGAVGWTFTRLSLPSFILRAPSRCSCRISSGEVPLMGAIRSKWLYSLRI